MIKEEKKRNWTKNTEKSIKEIKSKNSKDSEELKKKTSRKLRTQNTRAPLWMLKKKKGENKEKKNWVIVMLYSKKF